MWPILAGNSLDYVCPDNKGADERDFIDVMSEIVPFYVMTVGYHMRRG